MKQLRKDYICRRSIKLIYLCKSFDELAVSINPSINWLMKARFRQLGKIPDSF